MYLCVKALDSIPNLEYRKEKKKDIFTPMFRAVLFAVTTKWNDSHIHW